MLVGYVRDVLDSFQRRDRAIAEVSIQAFDQLDKTRNLIFFRPR